MCWLVADDSLKSLFLVLLPSDASVEGFEGRIKNEITMLQCKCSLLTIFPSFLTGSFLVETEFQLRILLMTLCVFIAANKE